MRQHATRFTTAALIAAAAALSMASSASASSYYWVGDVNLEWTTPGALNLPGNTNWATAFDGVTDPGVLPVGADDVFFHATGAGNLNGITVSAESALNSLTFLSTASPVTISNNSTATGQRLNIGSGGVLVDSAGHTVGMLRLTGTQTWTLNHDFTIGRIQQSGTRTLNKEGVGTLTVTTQLGVGTLNVNTGMVDLQAGGTTTAAIGGTGTLTNTSANNVIIQDQGSSSTTRTYSATLTQNLNVERGRGNFAQDTGKTILAADNTYTGTTTVNIGTLLVNGTHTGGGNYSVLGKTGTATNNHSGADGILGGIGTITLATSKTVTVTGFDFSTLASFATFPSATPISYGRIAPGDGGIGALTITAASLTLGNLSRFDVEVDSGSSADLLALTGDLIINAGSGLNVIDLGAGFGGSTYTILTYTGTRSGEFSSVSGLGSGYSVVYNDAAKSIQLVIPEPVSLALLGVGGLLMLSRRRRQA